MRWIHSLQAVAIMTGSVLTLVATSSCSSTPAEDVRATTPGNSRPPFTISDFEDNSAGVRTKAQADAEHAIQNGQLAILGAGLPGEKWQFHAYVLKTRYGITQVATGCTITTGVYDIYYEVYNARMMEEIRRKFGQDVFEKVDDATDLEYQLFLDRTAGDFYKQIMYRKKIDELMQGEGNWGK